MQANLQVLPATTMILLHLAARPKTGKDTPSTHLFCFCVNNVSGKSETEQGRQTICQSMRRFSEKDYV